MMPTQNPPDAQNLTSNTLYTSSVPRPNIRVINQSNIDGEDEGNMHNFQISHIINNKGEQNNVSNSEAPPQQRLLFNGEQLQKFVNMQNQNNRIFMEQYNMVRSSQQLPRSPNNSAGMQHYMYNSIPIYNQYPPNFYYPNQPPPYIYPNHNMIPQHQPSFYMSYPGPNPSLTSGSLHTMSPNSIHGMNHNSQYTFNPNYNPNPNPPPNYNIPLTNSNQASPTKTQTKQKINPLQYVFQLFNNSKQNKQQMFLNIVNNTANKEQEIPQKQQQSKPKQNTQKQSVTSKNSINTNVQKSLPNPQPSILINLVKSIDSKQRHNYNSLKQPLEYNQSNHLVLQHNIKKTDQSHYLQSSQQKQKQKQKQKNNIKYLQAPTPTHIHKSLKRIKTQSSGLQMNQSQKQIILGIINQNNSVDIGVQTIVNQPVTYTDSNNEMRKSNNFFKKRQDNFQLMQSHYSLLALQNIDLPPQYRQQLQSYQQPEIRMVESTLQTIYTNIQKQRQKMKTTSNKMNKKAKDTDKLNKYNNIQKIKQQSRSQVDSNLKITQKDKKQDSYGYQKQGKQFNSGSIKKNISEDKNSGGKQSVDSYKPRFPCANSISIMSSDNNKSDLKSDNKQQVIGAQDEYMEESVVQQKQVVKYKTQSKQKPKEASQKILDDMQESIVQPKEVIKYKTQLKQKPQQNDNQFDMQQSVVQQKQSIRYKTQKQKANQQPKDISSKQSPTFKEIRSSKINYVQQNNQQDKTFDQNIKKKSIDNQEDYVYSETNSIQISKRPSRQQIMLSSLQTRRAQKQLNLVSIRKNQSPHPQSPQTLNIGTDLQISPILKSSKYKTSAIPKQLVEQKQKLQQKQRSPRLNKKLTRNKSLSTAMSVSKLSNLITAFSELRQIIQFEFKQFNYSVKNSFQQLIQYFSKIIKEKEQKIMALQFQKNCLFDRIKILEYQSTTSNKNQQKISTMLNSIPSSKTTSGRLTPKMQITINQPYFRSGREIKTSRTQYYETAKDYKKEDTFKQYKIWRQISTVENLLQEQASKLQQTKQKQFKKNVNKYSDISQKYS